jgi:hypothetical protein
MPEINYTCSLGSLCHTSKTLKRTNHKLCSYPFDWIFSNCDNIIHCIEDDFNIFLDKSYYVNIGETQCGHSKYYDCMFNHHNPLMNIDHYNYYVRCVDRFRSLLKKEEHKLFMMISVNNSNTINDEFKSKIVDFNNKFSKYTSNYTLLVIYHIPNQHHHRHMFTYDENIHYLELHTLSPSGGSDFYSEDDNVYLDNVINSSYVFNLKP